MLYQCLIKKWRTLRIIAAISRLHAITIRTIFSVFFHKDLGATISPLGTINTLGLYFLFLLLAALFVFIVIHFFETTYLEIRPEMILMAKATIKVLKAKESSPCIQVSLLILLEVICTSETWKVMPTTKEK